MSITSTSVFERQVLDALPLTVYTVDLDGRVTSANRTWSRFAEENGAAQLADERAVVGHSLWDAISDRPSREQIERAMALLKAGRAPVVSWEFPCNSPDEERVFLMQITPLHDDARAVSGFVFSNVDITPSHRSREALIDAGIALSRSIDLDRVFHEVVQQVRRAVRCEGFAVAVAGDDASALRVAHQTGYEDGAQELEQRLTPTWHDALATRRAVVSRSDLGVEVTVPMSSTAGVHGAMTLLADNIESPQQLDEAQRLLHTLAAQTASAIERARLVRQAGHKRRLEAVGEVAAGVAHEFRNPLFGISSAAQLLRFRAREDPVVEKNVGRILREVERLNRMVTSLLEYGRPSTLTLAPGDPDAVWDDVLDGQRGRLESRALALRRTRANPPARIAIDAEQLTQAFSSLLVNAIDAAPEASDLGLVSTVLGNGAWRCRLHNAGPPIPADVLPRVFEVFFSTKPGAAGLGLALCQRIVEDHRGTISVESSAEHGTTFTVVLPSA